MQILLLAGFGIILFLEPFSPYFCFPISVPYQVHYSSVMALLYLMNGHEHKLVLGDELMSPMNRSQVDASSVPIIISSSKTSMLDAKFMQCTLTQNLCETAVPYLL